MKLSTTLSALILTAFISLGFPNGASETRTKGSTPMSATDTMINSYYFRADEPAHLIRRDLTKELHSGIIAELKV